MVWEKASCILLDKAFLGDAWRVERRTDPGPAGGAAGGRHRQTARQPSLVRCVATGLCGHGDAKGMGMTEEGGAEHSGEGLVGERQTASTTPREA